MLPGEILRSKPVRENNEPMVAVRSGDGIFVDGGGAKFCRASVVGKLRNVAEKLKGEGYGIYVYDLYRSPDEQLERRRKQFLVLRRNLLMNVNWRCIFAAAQRALAAVTSQGELLTLRFVT